VATQDRQNALAIGHELMEDYITNCPTMGGGSQYRICLLFYQSLLALRVDCSDVSSNHNKL
jgi:hypothetical protein